MDSPLRYSVTFLATPAVSRNSCALKESPFRFFLCFCGFMFRSNHHLGAHISRRDHPTRKSSARLYKTEQRAVLAVYKMWHWTVRQSATGRPDGTYGIPHLAVLLVWILENGVPLQVEQDRRSQCFQPVDDRPAKVRRSVCGLLI